MAPEGGGIATAAFKKKFEYIKQSKWKSLNPLHVCFVNDISDSPLIQINVCILEQDGLYNGPERSLGLFKHIIGVTYIAGKLGHKLVQNSWKWNRALGE